MRGDFHNSHGQRRRGTTSPPSNHGRPPDEGGRGAKSRPHRGARGRGAYGGGRGGVWPGGDKKTFDDGKAVTAQFVKLLEEKQDGDGGLYTEDDVSSAEEEDVMAMLKMQDETMPPEEEQNLSATAPSAAKGNITEVTNKKVYEYSDDGWGDPPPPLKATDAPVAIKKGGIDGFTSSLPSVAAPPSTPRPAPVARAPVPSKPADIPKDSLAGKCRNRRRSRGNESPPFIGYQGFGSSSPADRSKPPTHKNHTFLGASFGSEKHAFSPNPVVPLTWGPKTTPATPVDTSSSGVQEKREYSDDGWGISPPLKTVNSTAAHLTSTSSGSQGLGSSSKPVEPIAVTPASVLPAPSEINSFVPPDGGYKDCRYVSSLKYIPYAMRQIFYSRPDGSAVMAPANQPPYAPPPPPPDPHATLFSPVASFFVELLTNRQKNVVAGSSAFSSPKVVVSPPRPEPSPPAPSIKPCVVASTMPSRFPEQKTEPAVALSKSQDIPRLPNQENKSVTEKRGFRGCGVEIEQRKPAACAISASKCADDVAATSVKKDSPQRISGKESEFSDDGWDDPPPPPKARDTIVASRKVADDEEVWSTFPIVERKEQPDSPRTFRRNLKIVKRERDGGYDYVHPQEISEEILLTRGFETLNPAAFSQQTRCLNQEKKRVAEKEGSGSGGISKIGSNSIVDVNAPSVKKDSPQGVTEGASERFDKLKPEPVVAPSKTQDLSRFLNQEMEQMTEKEGSGSFGISKVASNFADDVMAPSAKNEPIQTVSLTDIKSSLLTDPYPTAELDDRIVFVPFNFPTGPLIEDFFADLNKKGITVVRSGPIVVVPENFPTGPLIDSFFEDLKKKGLTVVTTSSAQGQSEPCSSTLPYASATSAEFKSSSKPTSIAADPTAVATTPAAPEIRKSENISSDSEGFRSTSKPPSNSPSIDPEPTPVTTTSAAPETVKSKILAEEHAFSDDGWGTSVAPNAQPEWMNNCACGLPIRALFGKDCCSVLAIANSTTLPTKPRWPQRKPKTQKTAPPKIFTNREYSDDGWGDTPLPKSTDLNSAPQKIAVLPQSKTPKAEKSTPTQPLTFTKATVRNKDGSLKAGSQISCSIRPATGGFGTSISSSSTSTVAPQAKKNPVHESGYLPPFLRSSGSLRRAPVSAKPKVSSKPSSSSTFGTHGGFHGFGSYSAPPSNAALTAVKNATSVFSDSTSFGPGFGGVGSTISPSSISAVAKKNSVYQGGFAAPFQRASESLEHTRASAKPKVSSKPSIGSGFGPATKASPTASVTVNPVASVTPRITGFGGCGGFGSLTQNYARLNSATVAVRNVTPVPSNGGFGPPFPPPAPKTLPTSTVASVVAEGHSISAGTSHRAPVIPAIEDSPDFRDMDRSGFIPALMNNEPMRSLIQTNYPDLYDTIIKHITNGVIVALNIQ